MSFKPYLGIFIATGLLTTGCGHATRSASPRSPAVGTAALTAAKLGVRYDKVLVAESNTIVMVARDGCVATLSQGTDDTGESEEMRVRCPRPERLKAWFHGVDQITENIGVERVSEDSSEEIALPAAELVTTKGDVLQVEARADAARLVAEVRALAAELASAEMPSPGPASANGWQMLHVVGPAHVFLGGAPTSGMLDARMSTNGQYLCEFVATTKGGPIRATKSGWMSPSLAARAIDEVLAPLADVGATERKSTTYALGITNGAERRANAASTGAVFVRFAVVQDVLGDACLPELDPPTAQIGL
ncbi:MAG: hypothetical protein JWP87_2030 [Labilithrix sp.]|nr:hypothetical protein [Labilithrix sp.]